MNAPKLSIVLPIRGRPPAMLARTLTAIRWQNQKYSAEVIVVSNGNTAKVNDALSALCTTHGARLVILDGYPIWNKPLTSNVGIRFSDSRSQYVMTMDVDILLAPGFFDAIYSMDQVERRFVLCQVGELPDGVQYPDPFDPTAYGKLRGQAKWPAPTHGIGGIQHAPRKFFFDVRGYDEEMIYWGSMDSDMADRSTRYGLKRTWINKRTSMLHQPHIKKGRILATEALKAAALKAHAENRRMRHARKNQIVRNPKGWGEIL